MIKQYSWFLFAILIYFSCASQKAPSGGPEDKTPPEIIKTTPISGAVQVSENSQIIFEYSEKIDRDSFLDAIFISPDPGDVEIKQKRKRTILSIKKPLLPQRTYVVTLGTSLQDEHNVKLDKSFTFAFSTGDSIDQGQMSGRVFDTKSQGILIWAYILSDSVYPDPAKRAGDYATQVGTDGRFTIPFMADGEYRIFAVEDAGKTGIYNPMEDRIAVADRDIKIDATTKSVKNLAFRMLRQDTLSPAISTAGMQNKNTIEIRFSEAISATDTNWTALFTVTDTVSNKSIQILQAEPYPLDRRRFDIITQDFLSIKNLRAAVPAATDTSGNLIDPEYAFYDFSSSVNPDTVAPRIVNFEPADKSRNVQLNIPIKLIFNEWMRIDSIGSAISLSDTFGNFISGPGQWENPFTYIYYPDTLLNSKTLWNVNINKDLFFDRAGNSLFDTVETRTFTTINVDTLSSIAGILQDQRKQADSSLAYILSAEQIDKNALVYKTMTRNKSKYLFESMLPGSYLIKGFIDKNGDGRYTFGSPVPFIPAEFYFQYPDTIKIRSKWPNEGEDIIITD
ncbi:MAG: hypothetical protein DWQ05_09320 [Calditrichaeota bacterium]|nr:MAG: hypothetical protein DWQ05_09320 [Calditrichota bacterium]